LQDHRPQLLAGQNLSEATRSTYGAAAGQLIAYLTERGVTQAGKVTRVQLEEWIGELITTRSAATANRYRAIQQWFKWMLDEDEIDENPVDRMRPPMVPEHPVDVLTLESG
jgi:site-specific recombinase XerD